MTADVDPTFEAMYDNQDSAESLPPWDIGGPQPVVEQLVAHGALRGRVLDPGTGPGYHAIHYASHGYAAVGIDGSSAAIARAKHNADRVGVQVDFRVADATTLTGLDGCFDTVIDSAFYHVLADDDAAQLRYARTLHRVTGPGARLFMFELGCHSVNGVQLDGLDRDTIQRVLGQANWRIDNLSTSSFVARFTPDAIRLLGQLGSQRGVARAMKSLSEQLAAPGSARPDQLIHLPIWTVAATRLDVPR